jgi:hypothetical protein
MPCGERERSSALSTRSERSDQRNSQSTAAFSEPEIRAGTTDLCVVYRASLALVRLLGDEKRSMKRWWEQSEAAFGDLVDGLTHLNRRTNGTISADYERYVGALTSFAKGYRSIAVTDDDRSDQGSRIRNFVRDEVGWRLDDEFFEGKAFRKLVRIGQEVAAECALRKARDRREFASAEAPADLEEAGETHAKFVVATSVYDETRDPQAALNVAYWLGALTYAIRSNLDHGEKHVVSAALPVIEDLALRTLEQPQYRLAVYGSLRAGQPNHHHIADLGVASYGSVRGTIVQRDSYPVFSWSLNGDEVPVEVYFTTRLTLRATNTARFSAPCARTPVANESSRLFTPTHGRSLASSGPIRARGE